MPEYPISFVLLQDERPLARLEALAPDRDWREFVTTNSAWVVQTYLRLKAMGDAVELRDSLPASGVAVVGAGDYRELLRRRTLSTKALIAVPLGSFRRRPGFADAIIVQNPVEADGHRRLFIPHWPQPGMLSRSCSRRPDRAGSIQGLPEQPRPVITTPGLASIAATPWNRVEG